MSISMSMSITRCEWMVARLRRGNRSSYGSGGGGGAAGGGIYTYIFKYIYIYIYV